MLKNALRSLNLSYISLALVGLMWVFPFLHYRHANPLTTFYQEWWSALLGVLALTALISRDYWRNPEIPRIAQLPAALIGIVLIQWGLGKVAYLDQSLLYILYLLFAALLMLLGARLRDGLGIAKISVALAVFLLVGAELNALIGIQQHYHWHTPLDSVVIIKNTRSVYGNLGQPNHFANYIALGMISLGLLFQIKKISVVKAVLLATPLLFVMTLSGSRSSWLYLLMMAGLAWWSARSDSSRRPLLRYSLLLIAGFGIMHLVVQLPFVSGIESSVNTVQRLFDDNASGSARMFLWREALLMFLQSPWLGVGFGQFAWHHFQLLPSLHPSGIVGLYNNAHNLVFQIAAEAGTAGLLALLLPLGVWLSGLRRSTLDEAHWWGYAILGVLAIHSLLEYPLWYTYFVAIAALLLGALDETRYRLELRNIGRVSAAVMLLLGFVSLVQLRNGYHDLEQVQSIKFESSNDPKAARLLREKLMAVYDGSMLTPYAELYMSSLIEVNDDHLKEKLAINTRVMHFVPIGPVVYRQVLLLAQAGELEQAKNMLVQAFWSYPNDYGNTQQKLLELAEKDPAHFSALIEFAHEQEQENRSAVHKQ